MKKFFGIESAYKFEWYDLTALITLANIILVLLGFHWAPLFGLANCGICLVLNVNYRAHINSYITQLALIVLNFYFLTL